MDTLELPAYSEDELDYEQDEEFSVTQSLSNKNLSTEKFDKTESINETDPKNFNLTENNQNKKLDNSSTDTNLLENNTKNVKAGLCLINNFADDVKKGKNEDSILLSKKNLSKKRSIHQRIHNFAQKNQDKKKFGVELENVKTSNKHLDSKSLNVLYESLNVDPNDVHLRLNAVYVKGVDKLSEFEIKRIFAEYNPETVQFIDENSCTVRWSEPEKVAQMFLGMTKMLRRVRTLKKVEDGELIESDEEEEIGQVKEENGDDIAVVGDSFNIKKRKKKLIETEEDIVEINVEEVKIPPGKWRVVTKHVPGNCLLILRYATGFEIRCGVINSRIRPKITFPNKEKEINVDKDGFEYAWTSNHNHVRPGLNVFDEKGNELEWDYEHDTRFFKESSDEEISDNNCSTKKNDKDNFSETTEVIGNTKIRSRGRGTKKFLAAFASTEVETLNTTLEKDELDGTLASDVVLSKKKKFF